MICQADRPGELLRKGKEHSIQKVIKPSEERHDEEVRERFLNYNTDIEMHWHSNCYASYTSQQNIRYKTYDGPQDEDGTVSSRTFRSGIVPVDWSKCFIWKNKTYKKSRDLTNVCTRDACQNIKLEKEKLERKGDSSMLHILNGVNGDLIPAGAKFIP